MKREIPVIKVMLNGKVYGYYIDMRTAELNIPTEIKYKIYYTVEVINDIEHTKLFNELLTKGVSR